MLHGKSIAVVLPAYNAEKTLAKTLQEIDRSIVDHVLLVDDGSRDRTAELSHNLEIRTFKHNKNYGYGRNQKTCYTEALGLKADIIIMLHPDYQYTPRLVPAMASMISSGVYDVVMGSRILCGSAIGGGMPVYKYFFNRVLTFLQNLLMGTKLSEFHTGYRAFSAVTLKALPYQSFSDDFVFDNEIIASVFAHGFRVGELSCPTLYADDSSSINFRRSVVYGLGVLKTSVRYFLHRTGLWRYPLLDRATKALEQNYYQQIS